MFKVKKQISPNNNKSIIIAEYMSARIAAYYSLKYNLLAEKSNSSNLFWVE